MILLGRPQHHGVTATSADQEEPAAMLRDTVVSCIEQMGRHLITKFLHGLQPHRKQRPFGESCYVLDEGYFGTVALDR